MEPKAGLEWKLKSFDELSNGELYDMLAIRSEVFVVEQRCAYQDLDGKDQASMHLMACRGGGIVAYARLLPPGLSYETASIGRIITRSTERGTGLGKALLRQAMDAVGRLFGTGPVTISAQQHLKAFYSGFGFVQEGDPYLEDDIPHIKMISFGLPAGNPG